MAKGWQGLTLIEDPWATSSESPTHRYQCPNPDCYYSVGVFGDCTEACKHNCPMKGETKIGWTVTKTLVEQVWDKLDACMVVIMPDPEGTTLPNDQWLNEAKIQARAYAEVLAIFMSPHFKTVTEVAKEARKRRQAALAGEPYETAGLGSLRYQSPPGVPDKYSAAAAAVTESSSTKDSSPSRRRSSTKNRAPKVPVQAHPGIRQAIETGMMTVEDLMKMYGTTADEINSIINS